MSTTETSPAAKGASRPAKALMDSPDRYLNRELSWLEFDRRVLALAEDASLPLLERVKFLAIFSRNLDEFFQVRVALLQAELESGVTATSADGLTIEEQLAAIRERVLQLSLVAEQIFEKELRPELAAVGLEVDAHGPVVEAVVLVVGLDLRALHAVDLVPAHDHAGHLLVVRIAADGRDHGAEVGTEVQGQPLVAVDRLPVARAP